MGASLWLYMGIRENFALAPVHAHIMLAGWVTLALAVVIFRLYPIASTTRLATAHFWLHHLGLPMFMAGLALRLTGHGFSILLPGGATAVLLGFVGFSANLWR